MRSKSDGPGEGAERVEGEALLMEHQPHLRGPDWSKGHRSQKKRTGDGCLAPVHHRMWWRVRAMLDRDLRSTWSW